MENSFERLRASFKEGKPQNLSFRKLQLKNLLRFLEECENDICNALHEDLHKPRFESLTSEIGMTRVEIHHAVKNLSHWARTRSVLTPLVHLPAQSKYAYEPKGVVLILAPWNYPVMLSLAPLVGAIAAGNSAVLKPSEIASHTSNLLCSRLADFLDTDCFEAIKGGPEVSRGLLQLKFDHIFFTGSTAIGKIVMQEAAKNLIPVTLELGGKCPVLVDNDADLEQSARRIIWGKFMNAGQVCLSPDYLLVQKSVRVPFVKALKKSITEMYGIDIKASQDYGRIISQKHLQRLLVLVKDQKIEFGGRVEPGEKYFEPTLVVNPDLNSALMKEEIFGPILPIIEYDHFNDAIAIVSKMPRPLAIYFFSKNKVHIKTLRSSTASGAFVINDTVSHVSIPALPFGGIGESGMGTCHGEDSFQAFSYKRAIFEKSSLLDIPLRYPPFNTFKERVGRWFLR